jgi:RNA recognition motif-containing protein
MESNNQNNQNEIFIRNIGFNTTEDKLKEFICGFVPEKDIEFCLIVKDKETNNSKGTAFVKFKNNTSYNKIMSIYNDNTSNTKHNDMNLFELDGRNLKLFPAVTRD